MFTEWNLLNPFRKWFDRNFMQKNLPGQVWFLFKIYVLLYCVFYIVLYFWGGETPEVKNWSWWVYAHMIDSGTVFETAKKGVNSRVICICGFLMNLLNIFFFGGVFISIFTNFFEETAQKVRKGQVRYKITGKHYVILGWDVVGASIVFNLAKTRLPIVILSSANPEDIRSDIVSYNRDAKIDDKNLYILNGSFTNEAELSGKTLSLNKAEKIFVLGEKGSFRNDSDTILVAINEDSVIQNCHGKEKKSINLLANIRSFGIYSQLKNMQYSNRNNVDVSLFNFYENWARRIWSHIPQIADETDYRALAYNPLTENSFVHLIIVGFGQMGQALAIEAARVAHYCKGKRTRITIVSDNLEHQTKFISTFSLKLLDEQKKIYGWEENAEGHCYKSDVEFAFINDSAESTTVKNFLKEVAQETIAGKQIPTLAICFSNLDAAFELVFSLPHEFTAKLINERDNEFQIPILLRNTNDSSNVKFGIEKAKGSWGNIKFFGNIKECYDIDQNIETFAKVLNSIYELCENGLDSVIPEDFWKGASEYNRWSSRHQALAFIERLRSIGYDLKVMDKATLRQTSVPLKRNDVDEYMSNSCIMREEDFEGLCKAEHNRWSVEKWLSGWSYAKERNDDLHKHDNLVDYSELDEETKNKDIRPLVMSKWILEQFCGVMLTKTTKNSAKSEG